MSLWVSLAAATDHTYNPLDLPAKLSLHLTTSIVFPAAGRSALKEPAAFWCECARNY